MRFVPRSVMVGFVKDRALLVFMAQLPHLSDVPWMVYPMVALVAVRLIVVYSTFEWHGLKSLPQTPESETTWLRGRGELNFASSNDLGYQFG